MAYKTRDELMQHAAFAHLNTDSDGNPCVWENHFTCRTCTSEQVDWTDIWSCQCGSECPQCGIEHEPCESIWIGPEDPELRALWESLPEGVGQGLMNQTIQA